MNKLVQALTRILYEADLGETGCVRAGEPDEYRLEAEELAERLADGRAAQPGFLESYLNEQFTPLEVDSAKASQVEAQILAVAYPAERKPGPASA